MYISKVSLVNYRNFKNAKVILNKGINTIIGENASGKTNLFRAIRLLLDDSLLSSAYKLNENDFNRELGTDWRGHWIIISIEFKDVSNDEGIQALFSHGAENIDSPDRATYNLFFRPNKSIRHKLSKLQEGDQDSLKELLNNISVENDYEVYFTGRSTVDFNDPETYLELVGDFYNVIFPEHIDDSKFGAKIPHQLSISKDISFTFIQALRDVVSDFHSNKNNPLLTLMKHQSEKLDTSVYVPISEKIQELNQEIEALEKVKEVREDIKSTLLDTTGVTYTPKSLSIKSGISDEAEKMLQSLKLYIGETSEDFEGGIHELSLGGANLIFLTLKLLEFKYQRAKETLANFLIIEEPEAHIHNHIQKTLFDRINYPDTQIIYSTHSTQISEVSNVKNMNILSRKGVSTEIYQPSHKLEDKNITQIQRYLDIVRSNLLFAKGVILVEGDAEEIIIPILVKQVFGISLDELGISLINIGSTGFQNVAQLFHNDRIQRKCAIITDLDAAICDVNIIKDDSDIEINYNNRVKRSAKNGIERKEKLDAFINGNHWLRAYYAEHTFEVDFIKASEFNKMAISGLIEQIYTDKNTKQLSLTEITSDKIADYGKRVLTMANHVGKGWFAIMVGGIIDYKTIIPNYILDAVVFAKDEYSPKVIAQIIRYRLKQLEISENDINNLLIAYLEDNNLKKIIHKLKITIPEDQLINFFEKINKNV
ncbi:AAA family ATPase [Gilliamella sp. B2923]|uniref:ATP-dependent nuclease n=1 Tax=Gilliamella sp. B2923 TaxID=2818005 RepID=UPI00226A1078|nr:AAA family ATPase [Gilliamella sp. B2923]MCX8617791.1 AAA family ATPase [Gilliamella sp. B2923]